MLRKISQSSPKLRIWPSRTNYTTLSRPISRIRSGPSNHPNIHFIQHRTVRTQVRRLVKPDPDLKLTLRSKTEALSNLAKLQNWFHNPSGKPILPGWSCTWTDWLAGWELLPICTRSETELTLEHFYGLKGSFTPVIFRMNKAHPDFIFRYNDSGNFYYYRMEDDDLFQFDERYDGGSGSGSGSEAALEAFSDKTVEDMEGMMKTLRVVPELEDAPTKWTTAFDEQLILLELELGGNPYPLTNEMIQDMRMRYSLQGGITGLTTYDQK